MAETRRALGHLGPRASSYSHVLAAARSNITAFTPCRKNDRNTLRSPQTSPCSLLRHAWPRARFKASPFPRLTASDGYSYLVRGPPSFALTAGAPFPRCVCRGTHWSHGKGPLPLQTPRRRVHCGSEWVGEGHWRIRYIGSALIGWLR